MKVLILGDIHGVWYYLRDAVKKAVENGCVAIIQVGDFGLMSWRMNHMDDAALWQIVKDSPIPIYFIDGNHDDCTYWTQKSGIYRVKDNLFYIQRGTITNIADIQFAFLGGAGSIDKDYRIRNRFHWDKCEQIATEDVSRLFTNWDNLGKPQIDVLVTHTPPNSIIQSNFDPLGKIQYGVGVDWVDPSAYVVEDVWNGLNNPLNISGHMHRSVRGPNYQILDIGGTLILDSEDFRKE